MRTSRDGPAPEYLGADLTDATARIPRAMDVCGLDRRDGALVARFWSWNWSGKGIDDVVAELRVARVALLDGPQAFAAPGRTLRACERATRAAGKTPDRREAAVGRPYGGVVLSCVDLFAALDAAGLAISPPGFVGGIGEVYPAHLWRQLAPGLAKKTTAPGLAERRALLGRCGVVLPDRPLGHDHLDAAIAALAAAAGGGAVPDLAIRWLGEPLLRGTDGVLREGPIAVFDVGAAFADRLLPPRI
jgi:hypothetical protein